MHIDFEISERDYVHGQSQVMMPRISDPKSRIKVLILPFVGVVVIGRSLFSGTTRLGPVLVNVDLLLFGVGCVLVPLSIYYLVFGSLAWRNRKIAKVIYRGTPPLQARLFLDVNEAGMEFTGQNFFWKASWAEFTEFFEDRRVFVLYQRNPKPATRPIAFHIVPKRALSPEQITELRQYLQRNIGLAKRNPKHRPFAPSAPPQFH